jgi:ubiquinone biosynthesis monooxygenase Coq7
MPVQSRQNTPLDTLLGAADNALRALFAPPQTARPIPAVPDTTLTSDEKRHAAGLMRVNHSGEVAAQALYHGQAMLARNPQTRQFLLHAAREEGDHLAWCASRINELGSSPSRLNPLWYAGSFAIGALAAVIGDAVSLGFVVETEKQVEGHLAEHLQQLPANDHRSRAIVTAMRADEAGHAHAAQQSGAGLLPAPLPTLMSLVAKVMTRTAYFV